MTFPLRSSNSSGSGDENNNQLIKDLKSLNENNVIEEEVDESENKIVEKAKGLGVVENANDILREVFTK